MLDLPNEAGATLGDWTERMISALRYICAHDLKHLEQGCHGGNLYEVLAAFLQRVEDLQEMLTSPVFGFNDEDSARHIMAECFELLFLVVGNQTTVPMLDVFRESVRTLHKRWEGMQPARLPDGTPVE